MEAVLVKKIDFPAISGMVASGGTAAIAKFWEKFARYVGIPTRPKTPKEESLEYGDDIFVRNLQSVVIPGTEPEVMQKIVTRVHELNCRIITGLETRKVTLLELKILCRQQYSGLSYQKSVAALMCKRMELNHPMYRKNEFNKEFLTKMKIVFSIHADIYLRSLDLRTHISELLDKECIELSKIVFE